MRALLALVLASLGFACSAADADPKLAAAQRLVALFQIDEIYSDAAAACRERANIADDVRRNYEANRARFEGLSPQSAYWPEVEALYSRYRADVCGGNTAQAAKTIYAHLFARRLSQDELDRAIASYDTPEGRALQAASREAAKLLTAYQLEAQERDAAAAGQRFHEKMRELIARFKADPR